MQKSTKSPKKKRTTKSEKVTRNRADKNKALGGSSGGTDRKDSTATLVQAAAADSVECAIVLQRQQDKFELFDETLRRAGFWFALEQARFKVGAEAAAFRILIKPDFTACEMTGSLATDPQLVERLIDLLHDRGFTQVVVAESRNSFDICLENRDVQILADMLGYQYVTPAGRDYDVIDLGEVLQEVSIAEGNVLHGASLSRHWLDADFRILFAKNRTDDVNAYSLCAESLISILPLRDKEYHYRHRLKAENVFVELIRETRVDFCIIDAYVSNHGNAGSRCARPIETSTFIAGRNLLLTDFAAAKKMGLDPYNSPLNAKALREIGLPEPHRIEGDLTPYSGWINVHPLMLDSARRRERWPEVSKLLAPWLQTADQQLFPFKDPLNGQINLLLSRYFSGVDDNQSVFWSVVGVNYLIALICQVIETYQILYWKDRLWQKEVPLNISLSSYPLEDYEAIVGYLEPLEKRVLAESADESGLRWCYNQDGSILFEFSRTIPVDYDGFVSRVDITRSIQYMNDYIGGVIVPVQRDGEGRTTHQGERNLYLPQPNYLALFQGQDIDVTKLELIRYGKNEQKMFWKTLKSENRSADYDDGWVFFKRLETGDTHVSIFGRQKFTLPLFWQLVDLDRYPILKNFLVTHAYTTFFSNTMANFEAVNEGREVRIGRAWNKRAGEADDDLDTKPLSNQVVDILKKVQALVQEHVPDKNNILTRLFSTYKATPQFVDDDGFAHFCPAADANGEKNAAQEMSGLAALFQTTGTTAQGFWKELYEATQRDAGVRHD